MFTIVAPTANLSLDSQFIKKPAATFFAVIEGDGMAEREILDGDTLIVDRSRTPGRDSIVVAAIDGELTIRPFADLLLLPKLLGAFPTPLRPRHMAGGMTDAGRQGEVEEIRRNISTIVPNLLDELPESSQIATEPDRVEQLVDGAAISRPAIALKHCATIGSYPRIQFAVKIAGNACIKELLHGA